MIYPALKYLSINSFHIITGITAQQKKSTIAILDVVPKNVEQSKIDIIFEYIMDRINKAGKYIILERAVMDRALAELEISHSEIVDEAIAVKIDKISGATLILLSSLLKEGTKFYLFMRVLAVGTGRISKTSIKNTDDFDNI
jgi:hypothetical protein